MSATPFTPDQLDAIDVARRHLDACVVAGPGSGKTTVLVEYFRRLVESGVDPLRILAITFTEKAAGNMRKKLAGAFHEDPAIRAKLERAWVSTVHGFCARLLRENAVFAGVDPEFTVADERDSWRMQQEAVAAAIDEAFQADSAGLRALIRALSSPDFDQAILSAYDAMRGAGVRIEELSAFPAPPGRTISEAAVLLRQLRAESLSNWSPAQRLHAKEIIAGAERIVTAPGPREALAAIEEFPAKLNSCKRSTAAYNLIKQLKDDLLPDLKYPLISEFYAPQRQFLLGILERFDRIYRARKRQAGALDFADLEEYAVRLLEDDQAARERLQAQFDHILMDEFQDTNGQQARLLKLVRPPDRFYAVGDINQSIFGFRHAEPQGFAEYRDEIQRSGRRLVNLAANFRSRPEILSAVETITAGQPGIEARPLLAGRQFETARPLCVEVIGVCAEPAAEALRIEAKHVARRILELLSEEPRFEFKHVAVLVRNTEVLGDFAEAFEEAGIPYVVNRGRGFYESREVNDLTHLLRVIANPRDEVSLAVVLRSPLVAVSDEALVRLRMMEGNMGAALHRLTPEMEADFGAGDYARLARFRDLLRDWRIRRNSVTFDRLLLGAMDDCGYSPEGGPRGAGKIDKFLAQARDAASRMTLDEFVQELALVRESNPRETDAPPEDSSNAVQVMTVHSAKGLEYPIVFVSAIHKGVENNVPVVAFSPRIGLGARWRYPVKSKQKDKSDLYQHAIREERKIREEQESRRLLYVAMTRAEEHLVLSFSGKKPKEWAQVVASSLQLDTETLRDEVIIQTAPDGKRWALRVLMTDRAPELLPRMRPAAAMDQIELLDAPAISEQRDANATVTALAQFTRCPRQYYLASYLGFDGRRRKIEDLDDPADLPADELGSQVHALLAGASAPDAHPEAVKLAEVFRRSPLGRRLASAKRIEREFDFLMAIEDLVLRGQVDLWFEEGGELVVVDYKTDAVSAVEAHQRARDYELQVRLYALAVERVAGRPVSRAWLHFLRPDTAIEVDITPSLLDPPEQIVRDFQEAQSNLAFPMNIAGHCKRCPFYRGLCPAE
jgi:ATP-dependent exoDNAse (exonuclease V) beta subunit